MFVKQNIDIL